MLRRCYDVNRDAYPRYGGRARISCPLRLETLCHARGGSVTAPELPPLEPETRALGYGLKMIQKALEEGFRDENTDAIEDNDAGKQSGTEGDE